MQDAEGAFRIVDRRHTAFAGEFSVPKDTPAGYRAHSILLGHHTEDQAVALLRDKGVHADAMERLLNERASAQSRLATLPALAPAAAALPIQDAAACAEINQIMSRPDCKAVFPEGRWSAELVEIAKLIAVSPSLDVAYAESSPCSLARDRRGLIDGAIWPQDGWRLDRLAAMAAARLSSPGLAPPRPALQARRIPQSD
jgi:hypothetical protein